MEQTQNFTEGIYIREILKLGTPIALQDLLTSMSFLVILAIVNSLGLIVSAGVGVAEKMCGFLMLVPSAFMQSMSAFVAQNIGAKKNGAGKESSAMWNCLLFGGGHFYGVLHLFPRRFAGWYLCQG